MDILFDIGRVLLDFDFESSMRRLLKTASPEESERLMRAIDARDGLERGQMEVEHFVNASIEDADIACEPHEFITAWRNIFTRNVPMLDVVKRLKASGDHRLILFSNTNAIHCPWVFTKFPELLEFDGRVLSYEVGAMKPEDAIYEYAIHNFNLVPTQTRYIDDLPDNIATGTRMGFRSHQYRIDQHATFESWLNAELDMEPQQ